MPRGKPLNEFQKGQIVAYKSEGKGVRDIARHLHISPNTVSYFIRHPESHKRKKKTGRPKKLTQRDQRTLLRKLKMSGGSVSQAQSQAGITHVSKRTVYNYIKCSKKFIFKKRKHHPKWKYQHIEQRLQWAKEHMSWSSEWTTVVFSDEKKFNLDGPDGYQYYWHCLDNDEETYSTRQMGGGSLMVWLAVGYGGRTSLVFLSGRQNHTDYIQTLNSNLLPYGAELGGNDWIFQQDGASIHTANGVKNWFQTKNVRILQWPAKSPDLNIVENIWSMIVTRVYAGGKQFESVAELQKALNCVWDNFCQTEIQSLYDSMPNRIFEVIRANGKRIPY